MDRERQRSRIASLHSLQPKAYVEVWPTALGERHTHQGASRVPLLPVRRGPLMHRGPHAHTGSKAVSESIGPAQPPWARRAWDRCAIASISGWQRLQRYSLEEANDSHVEISRTEVYLR